MTKYEDVAVHGYEEFCKAVSERKGKDIFAYFSGDKDDQGKSWCPDCVKGTLTLYSSCAVIKIRTKIVFLLFSLMQESQWSEESCLICRRDLSSFTAKWEIDLSTFTKHSSNYIGKQK